ncbi:Transmembrane protein 87A [Porphyridium purpureum]|uniref:Transmembrane protein 87A n=1 Tax=Porphyridium purpureum TaxID=35688 RepID=A0A5J4Z780_PORPP|nr:Transmembrane protein 87A [Porphyridium purpureum]|eukprot:POR7901..scf295_1
MVDMAEGLRTARDTSSMNCRSSRKHVALCMPPRCAGLGLAAVLLIVTLVASGAHASIHDVRVPFSSLAPENHAFEFSEGGIYAWRYVVAALPPVVPGSGDASATTAGSNTSSVPRITFEEALQHSRSSFIALEVTLEGSLYPDESMYTPPTPKQLKDEKNSYNISNGKSFFEVAVVSLEDEKIVGVMNQMGVRQYCCTPELARYRKSVDGDRGACSQKSLDRLVMSPVDIKTNRPWQRGGASLGVFRSRLRDEYVHADTYKQRIDQTIYIRKTGIYKLVVAACGQDPVSRSLVMEGQVIVKNPSGYLPGQLVGFMRSYEVLYYVYLGLTVLWIAILALRSKYMLSLHVYISAVLVLALLESMLFRHAYHSLNSSGRPLSPLPVSLVTANLVSVLKIVFSKALILLVSMGWCIVKASLGRKVVQAVVVYSSFSFIFSLAHEVASSATHKTGLSFLISALIAAPAMFLDLLLVFWIFVELSRTRTVLRERSHASKLNMYRFFTLSLVVFLCAALGVGIYSLVLALTSSSAQKWNYQHWESYYLLGGFPAGGVIWDLLFGAMLVIQMILFFPGERSASYAPSRREIIEDEPFLGASMEQTDLRNAVDVKAFFTLDDE